jgi:hypothetical protein
MATVEEAADTFAKDLAAQNIAGLMMVFTPEGMMKAMQMQGQMQARAAQALAAGKAPEPMTSHNIDLKGQEGEDQVVHLSMLSADGSAEIMTRWREIDGIWKVNDMAIVGAKDSEGNAVDLSAPVAVSTPPPTPSA